MCAFSHLVCVLVIVYKYQPFREPRYHHDYLIAGVGYTREHSSLAWWTLFWSSVRFDTQAAREMPNLFAKGLRPYCESFQTVPQLQRGVGTVER